MALVYTAEQAAQPGEELLLDYGFETYWTVQVGAEGPTFWVVGRAAGACAC